MAKQAREKESLSASAAQQHAFLRLLAGDSAGLTSLARTAEGLIDLRGVSAPELARAKANVELPGMKVEVIQGAAVVRSASWAGIDFSGANLEALRFFHSTIDRCKFDDANCEGWRMWGTRIGQASFRGASLRSAVLGAVEGSKRNAFLGVDFSSADLRGTVHGSSDMVDCSFVKTKLKKVEFNGTCFSRCRFEGLLDETMFGKFQFKGEHLPPNLMDHVDFQHAVLKWVDFRNLDLDTVSWPDASEHFIIADFRNTAGRAIEYLSVRRDAVALQLSSILQHRLKWAGEHQRQSIVSRAELMEIGGEEAVVLFKNVIAVH